MTTGRSNSSPISTEATSYSRAPWDSKWPPPPKIKTGRTAPTRRRKRRRTTMPPPPPPTRTSSPRSSSAWSCTPKSSCSRISTTSSPPSRCSTACPPRTAAPTTRGCAGTCSRETPRPDANWWSRRPTSTRPSSGASVGTDAAPRDSCGCGGPRPPTPPRSPTSCAPGGDCGRCSGGCSVTTPRGRGPRWCGSLRPRCSRRCGGGRWCTWRPTLTTWPCGTH
mmetsp:Transcript_26781/g.53428  ORF Transcript_26781/g.53428 Transcript_26781/m.53428 type:complete len:222 (-) Transcript_26781:438-1103(-)